MVNIASHILSISTIVNIYSPGIDVSISCVFAPGKGTGPVQLNSVFTAELVPKIMVVISVHVITLSTSADAVGKLSSLVISKSVDAVQPLFPVMVKV